MNKDKRNNIFVFLMIRFEEKKGLAEKQDKENKRKTKEKSKVLEQVQHECFKAHVELKYNLIIT
jgi:hypothetical protein